MTGHDWSVRGRLTVTIDFYDTVRLEAESPAIARASILRSALDDLSDFVGGAVEIHVDRDELTVSSGQPSLFEAAP